MTGDSGGAEPGWSDLPDDLIVTIYLRYCSSQYDHARFTAVCTSWRRAVAQRGQPAPPLLPLLLPSTGNGRLDRKARAYSPEDRRGVRVPWFPWGKRFVGSYDGGWIAAASGSLLLIVNVFSGRWVRLPREQTRIACGCPTTRSFNPNSDGGRRISFTKIIFSREPVSSRCLLAAMTTRCDIALCFLGCGGWTTRGCHADTHVPRPGDIAFCNGELYGLSFYSDKVFKYKISVNAAGDPVISAVTYLSVKGPGYDSQYIFELHDKLAIAVKRSVTEPNGRMSTFYSVFELRDGSTTPPYRYTWDEVMSLGDHALFLGQACSKVVHVSDTTSGVEKNHIYYSEKRSPRPGDMECLARLDLGTCAVYRGVKEGEWIKSTGYHYLDKDSLGFIWLLPPPKFRPICNFPYIIY